MAHYNIALKTGGMNGAGTNADVAIELVGTKGRSGWFMLDHPGDDDRERGNTDKYGLDLDQSIGDVTEVRFILRQADNDRPDWFLEYVTVTDFSRAGWPTLQFDHNGWIPIQGKPEWFEGPDLTVPRSLGPTPNTIIYAGGATPLGYATAANDFLRGTLSVDVLDGLDGNDSLQGLGGDDVLRGGVGNDVLEGGPGTDLLDGGAGNDTASYATAAAGVTVSLATASAQGTSGAGVDTLTGIEAISGSEFGDRLIGDGGANRLLGLGAADTLYGGAGADTLDGGTGGDSMAGGAGDDLYVVDGEADIVDEAQGGGNDTVHSGIAVTRMAPWVENLVLTGVGGRQDAEGNALDNRIFGNAASNAIHGGNGGGDFLHGGAGDDLLSGGDGQDTLVGGEGTDVLFGGGLAEADLFVFEWERISPDYRATGAAGDFIDTYAPTYLPTGLAAYLYDFHEWDGDRIDLRAIDADLGAAGDQAFRYVGTAEFTGAGQVRLRPLNDHVVVEADVDGGGADWKIALAGAHPYVTADTFLL